MTEALLLRPPAASDLPPLEDPVVSPGASQRRKDATECSVSIWVVEEQTAVRQMLASHLGGLAGFKLAGSSDTWRPALEAYRRERFSCVVMALAQRDGGGMAGVCALRLEDPALGIVVCTRALHPEGLRAALRAGVHGYVHMADELWELEASIRCAAEGATHLSSSVGRLVARMLGVRRKRNLRPPDGTELDVLRRICAGESLPEIALARGLEKREVALFSRRLHARFGVNSQIELRRVAIEVGLVGSDCGVG
ncbi:MAG: hypothetical protein ACKODK_16675 [Opitutaceae bacterium]